VFDEADAALQLNLRHLIWEGPADQIKQTEIAQPAILTHSIAVLRIIQRELGISDLSALCRVMMGHSLGEFSALCAAGAISFVDVLSSCVVVVS